MLQNSWVFLCFFRFGLFAFEGVGVLNAKLTDERHCSSSQPSYFWSVLTLPWQAGEEVLALGRISWIKGHLPRFPKQTQRGFQPPLRLRQPVGRDTEGGTWLPLLTITSMFVCLFTLPVFSGTASPQKAFSASPLWGLAGVCPWWARVKRARSNRRPDEHQIHFQGLSYFWRPFWNINSLAERASEQFVG